MHFDWESVLRRLIEHEKWDLIDFLLTQISKEIVFSDSLTQKLLLGASVGDRIEILRLLFLDKEGKKQKHFPTLNIVKEIIVSLNFASSVHAKLSPPFLLNLLVENEQLEDTPVEELDQTIMEVLQYGNHELAKKYISNKMKIIEKEPKISLPFWNDFVFNLFNSLFGDMDTRSEVIEMVASFVEDDENTFKQELNKWFSNAKHFTLVIHPYILDSISADLISQNESKKEAIQELRRNWCAFTNDLDTLKTLLKNDDQLLWTSHDLVCEKPGLLYALQPTLSNAPLNSLLSLIVARTLRCGFPVDMLKYVVEIFRKTTLKAARPNRHIFQRDLALLFSESLKSDRLDVAQLLVDLATEEDDKPENLFRLSFKNAIEVVAQIGKIKILKWLLSRPSVLGSDFDEAVRQCSISGQFHALRYLFQKQQTPFFQVCITMGNSELFEIASSWFGARICLKNNFRMISQSAKSRHRKEILAFLKKIAPNIGVQKELYENL